METSRTVHRGQWWLPGGREAALPGALVIEPNGYPQLELIHGFQEVTKEQDGGTTAERIKVPDEYPIIYGQCGDVCFTLLNCSSIGGDDLLWGQPRNQLISANRALQGDRFLADSSEEAVEAVRVRMDYLVNFAGLSGFDWDDEWDGRDPKSTASYTRQEPLTASWRNMSFRIGLGFSTFTERQTERDLRQLSATEYAWLIIEFTEPVDIAAADEAVHCIQQLLTIAIDQPCATRSITYQMPVPEPETDWEKRQAEFRSTFNIEVFARRIYAPDKDPYKDPRHQELFTLRDVRFDELIPRWMDVYERASTGIQMLCGTRYMQVGYVSTRLMNVCAAMEAIHSGLYDQPRMEPEDYDKFKMQACLGLDQEYRSTLHKLINNRMFFRDRAMTLAGKIGNDAAKKLLGDVEGWAKLATTRRNAAAHALEPGTANRVPGQDVFLASVTRSLLNLVLVKELGVGDEQFAWAVQTQWPIYSRWHEINGWEAVY